MKVIIQGMRRSGTTILYDALCQDAAFDAWYEPFGPAKYGRRGGGSGVQTVEFAARTRALRDRFCAERDDVDDPNTFNHGAPRDAALELEPALPEPCLAYLRHIFGAAPDTLVKFVRMAHKLAVLQRLVPDALLLHVVRDPRRVAVSQMLSRERIERGIRPERFFARRGTGGLWASRALADALEAGDASGAGDEPTDVERVLRVWRALFRRTHDDGRALFGERYLLVRHEDLAADPASVLGAVYRRLDREPPAGAVRWAAEHVRAPGPPLFAEHAGWADASERVGLARELAEAGYSHGHGDRGVGDERAATGGRTR